MAIDTGLARILDANANRVREGIRTAEDFVRFLIGDLQQAARLKLQRQTVTEILTGVPGLSSTLVEARNVSADPMQPEHWKDVLRRIDVETPLEVAQRGLKRAQEGLRVLEENLRGVDAPRAEQLSRLRYLAYESEQWLTCASAAAQVLQGAKVYVLLTSKLCANGDAIATAKAVLKGGVKALQLREKEMPDAEYLALARRVRELCAESSAVFFSNDRVDLGLLSNSAGVHLGQGDMSLADARKLAGRKLLIGRSTHSASQAQAAVAEGADYIGIGSMYETKTKAAPIMAGLKLAEEVAALNLSVPVFAIGGITLERAKALQAAGVRRVAVSTAVIGAPDPEYAAHQFAEEWNV